MQENDVIDIIYRLTFPILVLMLGYFLRGILSTIKRLEENFSQFRVDNAGQGVLMHEYKERLEKIEGKLDQYDRDFKLFYMEYGSVLKKAKRDLNH